VLNNTNKLNNNYWQFYVILHYFNSLSKISGSKYHNLSFTTYMVHYKFELKHFSGEKGHLDHFEFMCQSFVVVLPVIV
jgi:hypothetical protein